ncbi:LamG-like jellyroll fold domain-containing protein [Streptomyces sp. NPDC006326]|uniref:LamG-like jellyroll fold domain-containing protein n=1 Tax=Streptomyces sp. NPDC006326 TaxID=3156752 RepID=UPI0033A6A344
MTDGTHPSSHPQPEPAPGNGGYGFPPVPPAPGSGYGFPPGAPAAGGGFGPPPQVPPADGGGYGYPQQGAAPPNPYQPNPVGQPQPWAQGLPVQSTQPPVGPAPVPFPPQSDQPDWEAMADRSAAEQRKKRLWMIGGGVTVLLLLAGGGTFLLLGGDKGEDEPVAQPSVSTSASPSPSGSKSKAPVDNTPTVKDDPTRIRDRSGKAPLKMGPDAGVFPIDKRFELRTKGNENSYAESEKRVVDTSKSFTVSAHVWNRAPKGRQIAVSQGNEKSFSFELGLDQVNGKPNWIFRVQTGDQGAEATTVTVTGESPKMEKTFSTLTATYDAERKLIALYVNGKKSGEAPVPGIYQAQGPLEIARSRHEDKWTAPWSGAMETLQTYDALLSPAQIDTLKPGRVDAKTKPAGSWLLY